MGVFALESVKIKGSVFRFAVFDLFAVPLHQNLIDYEEKGNVYYG